MKIINTINIVLCLFITFVFIKCGTKNSSDCNTMKMQLLLEDVFKKSTYYPTYSSYIPSLDTVIEDTQPPDSSKYFVYLYSSNIKIPDKEFYLHWHSADPSYPDSVILKRADVPSKKYIYSHKVGIELLDVNEDTTKLKISLGYARPNYTLINEGTLTYSFNEEYCRWLVLDSTLVCY